MTYELSDLELNNVLNSGQDERVEYFVTRVLESGELWTLALEEELLVLGTEDRDSFVTVFPHPQFALKWFEDSGLDEADLVAMDLPSWIEGNFKELADADVDICVFPTPSEDGAYLNGLDLRGKLQVVSELSK